MTTWINKNDLIHAIQQIPDAPIEFAFVGGMLNIPFTLGPAQFVLRVELLSVAEDDGARG